MWADPRSGRRVKAPVVLRSGGAGTVEKYMATASRTTALNGKPKILGALNQSLVHATFHIQVNVYVQIHHL